MADMHSPTRRDPTFSLRIGRWFEASATGWGIVAVPLVLLVILGAAAVGLRL